MMKLTYLLPIALLIAFVGCEKSPLKKDFDEKDLYGEWYLVKKEVKGNSECSGELGKVDKLVLNSNGTFVCVENGETVKGDWEAYPRIGGLALMESGDINCVYFDVVTVNSEELILDKDSKRFSEEIVYYTSFQVGSNE